MSRLFRPMVPVLEMLGDENMNDGMLRVLLALFQFADKDGNCHPTSEQLARIVRMHPVSVRKATAALLRAGWIEKTGKGGRGAAASYRINSHPYRSATATESGANRSATATEKEQTKCSATATTTVAGTATVSTPPIVKVHTNNIPVPAPDKLEREARATRAPAPAQEPAFDLQSEQQRKPAKPKRAKHEPMQPLHCGAELGRRWLQNRRETGARVLWNENTQARHDSEAAKAGITPEAAYIYAMQRCWQAFHARLYLQDEKPQHNGGQFSVNLTPAQMAQAKRSEMARQLFEPYMKAQNDAQTVDAVKTAVREPQLQLLEKKHG